MRIHVRIRIYVSMIAQYKVDGKEEVAKIILKLHNPAV